MRESRNVVNHVNSGISPFSVCNLPSFTSYHLCDLEQWGPCFWLQFPYL